MTVGIIYDGWSFLIIGGMALWFGWWVSNQYKR